MSFDEKKAMNTWRFNKEISFGDVVVIVGIVLAAAKLNFQVGDHERRISAEETKSAVFASAIGVHETRVSVLETKIKPN